MTTITVSIDDRMYERLARLAEERAAQPEDLVRVYLEYLDSGGVPLPTDDGPSSSEIPELLMKSSAWAWLAAEPDLYTEAKLEPFGHLCG